MPLGAEKGVIDADELIVVPAGPRKIPEGYDD